MKLTALLRSEGLASTYIVARGQLVVFENFFGARKSLTGTLLEGVIVAPHLEVASGRPSLIAMVTV